MELVIDVNVVLSSLLTKGDSFKVFALNNLFNKFNFVAPEFLLRELEKHKEEFLKRSKLSKQEFEEILEFLLEQITFIPKSEFSEFLPKAKTLLSKHLKDVPYLALALKLNCSIFSGDKTLRKLSPIEILSPKEMLSKF
ncbi:MAG: hypothetical protein KJ646_05655 [Nanoarchaeota archaeon]|nr:hypothetical protein [Nanoarchaeota archaeon]